MLGAFRPSQPLSGGLLWKIPWRLSAPRKQRQRQRLRRVDNVVAVLDNALRRQNASLTQSHQPQTRETASTSETPSLSGSIGTATTEELSATGEGQRLLAKSKSISQVRHGKGPKQGDFVPSENPVGVPTPGPKLLRDVVRETGTTKLIERWKAEMPTEAEMLPRDKYSMFDKKVKGYRKGVHKLPKWTRVSQRLNPPGF
ncbi:Putative ribosomal protein L31 [Septoria linicola]|uniref:Ribosomal protein L31 n=1 Tax=Septoria linicola TaxID=215465 RepID=A0A9Q9EK46_9PEZI|nr:putative ribosomal protein L31 [Septoria linicola]USW52874.1 Putative ribosomal protein L31 [Septoria linicola]